MSDTHDAKTDGQAIEPLLDKHQMAKVLGISTRHLDKLRSKGLPTVLLGGCVRFRPASVNAWLAAQESGGIEAESDR